MQTLNLVQGSPEWAAFRATTFNASEAAAMMGVSPHTTRSALLHQKHTGIAPEFDSATHARFEAGHNTEATFRPIAEDIIGDDLYPVTGLLEVDGLRLLASFDGLTMDGLTGYEHKLFNAELARQLAENGEPGPAWYWQLEHQLLVSGAESILFVTSDGTDQKCEHCNYESKPERRAQLIAGWKQFAADRAAYVPVEVLEKPVATAVTALPAVSVQVSGALMIRDNFEKFETALRDFIDNRLIRKPETDQQFADLDLQIKALKNAEAALDAAEAQMLAQVSSVDAIKRTKDMLHKLTRDNRLMAEKLLTARKEEIKGEIVAGGVTALREHVAGLNQRLGKPLMPTVPADFAGAIRNKRTVDSLREAVSNELTRAKIAASEIADRIQINLATLRELATGHTFLFADTPQIVLKASDDLTALVRLRIAEHTAAEQRKMDAERERIRAEEQAKAEKDVREKLAAEQVQREAEARALAATQQPAEVAPTPAPTPAPAPAPALTAAPVAPAPSVVPLRPIATSRAAPAATPPSLRLGVINERLSPIALTAEGLASLGFTHSGTDKAAKLYHEHEFPHICAALVQHIEAVQSKQAA